MAHAQKPDFVFRRKGRVHLNRQGRQFSRLLAAELCASAVVMVIMLDTPCSEVVWRVLAILSIFQFPLHLPSRASPVPSRFNWTVQKAIVYRSQFRSADASFWSDTCAARLTGGIYSLHAKLYTFIFVMEGKVTIILNTVDTSAQNVVARATTGPGFAHPLIWNVNKCKFNFSSSVC
jgi:hypothetical protein